jgi:hypothetical protein
MPSNVSDADGFSRWLGLAAAAKAGTGGDLCGTPEGMP